MTYNGISMKNQCRFNRTTVECKYIDRDDIVTPEYGFNRTTVECKSLWMMGHIATAARFNRTTVECKFSRERGVDLGVAVLIELQ